MSLKKSALSNMGYAIILVIIVGFVMIISAPMFLQKGNAPANGYKKEVKNDLRDRDYDDRREEEEYNHSHKEYNRDYEPDNSGISSGISSQYPERSSDDRNDINYEQISERFYELERDMNSKFEDFERRQKSNDISSEFKDKFICSLEGTVDSKGVVIPVDEKTTQNELKKSKIVFVCEYNH